MSLTRQDYACYRAYYTHVRPLLQATCLLAYQERKKHRLSCVKSKINQFGNDKFIFFHARYYTSDVIPPN